MKEEVTLLVVAILTSLPSTASGRTLEVPSQYPTIHAAMAVAAAGDVIQVACGTYREHDITMTSGVTLRGSISDPSCVIVDADSLGRVIMCSSVNRDTRIEGLSLRNGFAGSDGGAGVLCAGGDGPTIANCVLEANTTYGGSGAGLRVIGSSPVLRDCVFRDNEIIGNGLGGGVALSESDVEFSQCEFVGGVAVGGGACWVGSRSATFMSCEFRENVAALYGGGIYCGGLGTVDISDCNFQDNISYGHGGGLACLDGCQAEVTETIFVQNVADGGGGGGISVRHSTSFAMVTDSRFEHNEGGGAIVRDGTASDFIRCLFWGNHSSGPGGALWFSPDLSSFVVPAQGRIEHCTFAYNRSGTGAAVCSYESTPAFEHCVFAFQSDASAVSCQSSSAYFPTLSCCNVFGNEGGDWVGCISGQRRHHGNFSADPDFCDAPGGNFRLYAGSPCLPGHHPEGLDCGLVGLYGQGCGATATEPSTWGAVKQWFR